MANALAALVAHTQTLDSDAGLDAALRSLEHSSYEYCAAVASDGKVLGLCSLAHIRQLLSGRYGFALHARSRVRDELVPGYLRFDENTPLRTVLEQALSRQGDAFYQDILLVDEAGRLIGLIPTERLVQAQSALMMEQFALLEDQRLALEEINQSLTRSLAQQRELERHIVHQEKSVLVQTLAGGIAHEINNKLMPICGYTELMLVEALDVSPEFRGYCETIRDSAFESAKIIRQLLELSRPSPSEFIPVDCRQLITDALAFVQLRVRESATALAIDLPEGEISVQADATKIKQVLVNLMLNALDAMERTPAPRLTIGLAPSGGMAVLTVTDSGHGIAPVNLTRLFDPFFTTKAPDRGTGLGLSVSLAIVEQHGGKIRVESTEGHGTTFVLHLPLSTGTFTKTLATAPLDDRSSVSGASLLIIDDELPATMFVKRALTHLLSCRTETAANGSEAVERLSSGVYDVIISDVRMPGMNGVQLLEWLGNHRPDLVSRLMFITGDASASDLNARIAKLGIPILQKPFTMDALEREVRSLLALHHTPPSQPRADLNSFRTT
jgi:signal transduction histidine kinase/ActR/RegA family two-component response regulator